MVDVAHATRGQQLQTAFHLADGVSESIGSQLDLGDDRREQVRNALVHTQLDALGIDENEPDLRGRGAVEQAHDHGVDGHRLARTGRAGDQHMGHRGEVGGDDAAVDVLAHGEREPRFGLVEGLRFDHFAQVDGLARAVGNLNANGAFAGHALDQNALGAHGEAEVVGQARDARVLHARLGLELVGGDHRAGVDLDHLAAHVEFGAFFDQHARLFAQLVLANTLGAVGGVQQRAGRHLEAADLLGSQGSGAQFGVGAFADGDFVSGRGAGGGLVRGPRGGGIEAAGFKRRGDGARFRRSRFHKLWPGGELGPRGG